MSDERFFVLVAEELRREPPKEDLWRTALARSGGNTRLARIIYTQLRVEQLKTLQAESDRQKILAREEKVRAARHIKEQRLSRILSLILFFIFYSIAVILEIKGIFRDPGMTAGMFISLLVSIPFYISFRTNSQKLEERASSGLAYCLL